MSKLSSWVSRTAQLTSEGKIKHNAKQSKEKVGSPSTRTMNGETDIGQAPNEMVEGKR